KYHHPQPFYFYPIIFLMLVVPWTPFLIDALISARKWQWQSEDVVNRSQIFLLAWIVFPIVFFSFSRSKLPGYILPVLPPALLFLSQSIAKPRLTSNSRWPIITTGVICVAMGLAGGIYGIRVERLSTTCVLFASAPFMAAGIFAVVSKSDRSSALLLISGSLL